MNPDLSYIKLKTEQHRQFTPTKKWNLSLKVRLKFYPRGQFPLYYIYRIVKKASYRRNSPSTLKNTPAFLIIFGSIVSIEAGLKITVRSNKAVRPPVKMTGKTKFTSVISVALLRASSSKCIFSIFCFILLRQYLVEKWITHSSLTYSVHFDWLRKCLTTFFGDELVIGFSQPAP